ncbi:MAG: methyltransferase domain-containing protein [Natronomonas sp.]
MTKTPIDIALSNPEAAIGFLLDGPLHPGGTEATEELLDRAGVDAGTRLFDVGCGAGGAIELAEERGAVAFGLDRSPGTDRAVRGDLTTFPIGDDSIDVVLAECALCLSEDLDRTLSETRRVLRKGGRLALSDVVVEGDPPSLPDPVVETLCLDGPRNPERLRRRIDEAGFAVGGVYDHRDDLLAMRDTMESKVDYEGLLNALGARGQDLLAGIEELDEAVESGRISYHSMVATAE